MGIKTTTVTRFRPLKAPKRERGAHWRSKEPPEAPGGRQETARRLPGGPRWPQEALGGPRKPPEAPGGPSGARRWLHIRGYFLGTKTTTVTRFQFLKAPKRERGAQDAPRQPPVPRKPQEAAGGPRKRQEAPKKPQEATGGGVPRRRPWKFRRRPASASSAALGRRPVAASHSGVLQRFPVAASSAVLG